MDFHVDDVFGFKFTPQDVPALMEALYSKAPWTPEQRQLVQMAQDLSTQPRWEVATDFIVNNILEEVP